jgi:hypothetical protein
LTLNPPWTEYENTVVDPCQLQIPPGTTVSIDAENVVLAAGTIGTTRILLFRALRDGRDIDLFTTGRDDSKDVINWSGFFQLTGWTDAT